MSVTFYYTPQSSADRIHASLQALGIPYEEVRIDLRAGDQKKPEFLAVNPNGQVPAIVIDGTPMFESVAIQIALGERYGVEKGLWPALNSADHLTAITWLVWSQVNPLVAVFRYMTHTSDWTPKDQQDPKQAAAALADIHKHLAVLDARLKGREFIATGHKTLVDIDISAILGWALMTAKVDISNYTNVAQWLGRCGHDTGHSAA